MWIDIHTDHDWLSEMHEHLLIVRGEIWVKASLLTVLVNKFRAFVTVKRDRCVSYSDVHNDMHQKVIASRKYPAKTLFQTRYNFMLQIM